MTLSELVMSEIRAYAVALEHDEAALLDKLKKQVAEGGDRRQTDTRQEITKLRRRVQELEQMTAKLYEDKVCGAITEATFSVLIQKSEQERIQKAERLETLLSEAKKYEQDTADIQSWAAIIRKYLDIQTLDRETVDELIEHIEVGERTVVDGVRHQDIKVYYRFVGHI